MRNVTRKNYPWTNLTLSTNLSLKLSQNRISMILKKNHLVASLTTDKHGDNDTALTDTVTWQVRLHTHQAIKLGQTSNQGA